MLSFSLSFTIGLLCTHVSGIRIFYSLRQARRPFLPTPFITSSHLYSYLLMLVSRTESCVRAYTLCLMRYFQLNSFFVLYTWWLDMGMIHSRWRQSIARLKVILLPSTTASERPCPPTIHHRLIQPALHLQSVSHPNRNQMRAWFLWAVSRPLLSSTGLWCSKLLLQRGFDTRPILPCWIVFLSCTSAKIFMNQRLDFNWLSVFCFTI